MFGIVKLKHIVLWKSILFIPLMRIDKLFCGNCSSNVKADSLSFDTNGNITFGFKGMNCQSDCFSVFFWISSTAWHCSVSPQKKIGCKANRFGSSLLVFPQEKHQLSVSSIVCGIIRHSGLPELESNFHLQCGFEGTDIYHHQHPQGTTAHSHITLIRILWEVIPLTLPLKEVHCRHERGKTNHIYYLR